MAWIKNIALEDARGLLKKVYDEALKRAGRVWNITSVMSLNPSVARTSMAFYTSVMHGRSPLSRGQREMLAVVVSSANCCVY